MMSLVCFCNWGESLHSGAGEAYRDPVLESGENSVYVNGIT